MSCSVFTLGPPVHLPTFVTNLRYIVTLEKSRIGKAYNDNFCLFRCLATYYSPWKKIRDTNTSQPWSMDEIFKGTRTLCRLWREQCLCWCSIRPDTTIRKMLWNKREHFRIDVKRHNHLHLPVLLSWMDITFHTSQICRTLHINTSVVSVSDISVACGICSDINETAPIPPEACTHQTKPFLKSLKNMTHKFYQTIVSFPGFLCTISRPYWFQFMEKRPKSLCGRLNIIQFPSASVST